MEMVGGDTERDVKEQGTGKVSEELRMCCVGHTKRCVQWVRGGRL